MANQKPNIQKNVTHTNKSGKYKVWEYIESLLIALVIALLVRGFVIQAFKIPSSSMEPTLLIGDQLLVNRLSYVVKIPFTDIVLANLGKPKRGDVIVFRFPQDHSKDFIKRVIGTEGDTIEIKDKVIYLNGQLMKDPHAHFAEDRIFPKNPDVPRDNVGPFTVPKNSYFVMGDNRDRSLDSRFWGFVKTEELVGRALITYFSLDSQPDSFFRFVRWERIGKIIH
jgi:signal peptidase I